MYIAIFCLFSVIDGLEWFWMGSLQEYPVSAGLPQGSILGSTNFLLYINNLPDEVMCNISIDANDATLFSKSNQFVATSRFGWLT